MANVSLKTKKLKSGRLSYYLQYYDPDTKKRWKEYLGLYLITKPKDEFERTFQQGDKVISIEGTTPRSYWNIRKVDLVSGLRIK